MPLSSLGFPCYNSFISLYYLSPISYQPLSSVSNCQYFPLSNPNILFSSDQPIINPYPYFSSFNFANATATNNPLLNPNLFSSNYNTLDINQPHNINENTTPSVINNSSQTNQEDSLTQASDDINTKNTERENLNNSNHHEEVNNKKRKIGSNQCCCPKIKKLNKKISKLNSNIEEIKRNNVKTTLTTLDKKFFNRNSDDIFILNEEGKKRIERFSTYKKNSSYKISHKNKTILSFYDMVQIIIYAHQEWLEWKDAIKILYSQIDNNSKTQNAKYTKYGKILEKNFEEWSNSGRLTKILNELGANIDENIKDEMSICVFLKNSKIE